MSKSTLGRRLPSEPGHEDEEIYEEIPAAQRNYWSPPSVPGGNSPQTRPGNVSKSPAPRRRFGLPAPPVSSVGLLRQGKDTDECAALQAASTEWERQSADVSVTKWDRDLLLSYARDNCRSPQHLLDLVARVYQKLPALLNSDTGKLSPGGCEFGIEFRNGYLLEYGWQNVQRTLQAHGHCRPVGVGNARPSGAHSISAGPVPAASAVRGGRSAHSPRVTAVLGAVNAHLSARYRKLAADRLKRMWTVQRILDGDIQATLQLLLALLVLYETPVHLTEADISVFILQEVKDGRGAPTTPQKPTLQYQPLLLDTWFEAFGKQCVSAHTSDALRDRDSTPKAEAVKPVDDDYEMMTSSGVLIPSIEAAEALRFVNKQLAKLSLSLKSLSDLYDGTMLVFALALEGGYAVNMSTFFPSIVLNTVNGNTKYSVSRWAPLGEAQLLSNMETALAMLDGDGVMVEDVNVRDLVSPGTRIRALLDLIGRVVQHRSQRNKK
eukprot:scpid38133/ scgid22529/ 